MLIFAAQRYKISIIFANFCKYLNIVIAKCLLYINFATENGILSPFYEKIDDNLCSQKRNWRRKALCKKNIKREN